MNDAERIAQAQVSPNGKRMLGPKEKQRCEQHPRCWEVYRWTWAIPADGDHLSALQAGSDIQCVSSCKDCEIDC